MYRHAGQEYSENCKCLLHINGGDLPLPSWFKLQLHIVVHWLRIMLDLGSVAGAPKFHNFACQTPKQVRVQIILMVWQ